MGIGRSQVFRLCRAFEASGASGLISRKRGRASNRKRGETFRHTVLALIREHYLDFAPTLASGRSRANSPCTIRMMLMLDPTPLARGLPGKKVEVVNYPDGRFAIRFDGTTLPFRVFDKIRTVRPGAIVENKRLGAVLALVKEQQAAFAPHRRRQDPARQRPPNNLEAPGLPTKGRPPRHGVAAPTRLNRKTASIVFPLCNGERPCREAANPTVRHP